MGTGGRIGRKGRLAMKSQVEKIDKKILNKLKLGSG
jgi:hypothetical protein